MTISDTMRLSRFFKILTIVILVIFSVYFLVPVYVMIVNSFKPLAEIRAGNMMALPQDFSFDFWKKAGRKPKSASKPPVCVPIFSTRSRWSFLRCSFRP